MKTYDLIIIGGGISGLYLAYKLYSDYKDILLLEVSSELGGRIKTDTLQDFPVELGASRFSSNHKSLIKLINELNLKDKCIELPKKIDHIYENKKINYDLDKIKKIYKTKRSNKDLQKITLLQHCIDVFGHDEAYKLKDMYGYDAEFIKMNAYSAMTMFKKDLLDQKGKYYILNGGLSQIVNNLEDILKDKITIKKESLVTDITDNKIKVETNGSITKFKGTKIISAIPYLQLKKLELFKNYKLIDNVFPVPFIRIYAKYPLNKNGKVWFDGIPRTITDNYIRHIIPIDYENGIIMISYSDLYTADIWNNWSQLGEKVLTEKIHKEINNLFNITPPKPIDYKIYYWKDGVHMWKVNTTMNEDYKRLMKPFDDKEIYLCNESFSKHQCWIEGALNMAGDVIKKISTQKGSGKKTIKKKKEYKIHQVLRRKNWIIFEYKGEKWIHKISSGWFNDHPGGRDHLQEGVKANSYYDKKNKDKSKISPTKLFKSIGVHGTSNVFKEYIVLEKYPKKIKCIGLLKK
jgi:monoamine oxidase